MDEHYTIATADDILDTFAQLLATRYGPCDRVALHTAPTLSLYGEIVWGYASEGDAPGTFILAITEDMPQVVMRATMVHEWAHLAAVDIYGHWDHGPQWGVCYSEVYRRFYGTT